MSISVVSSLLLSLFLFSLFQGPAFAIQKSYVVYLGSHEHGPEATSADFERATNTHYELLGSVCKSVEKAKEKIFYSYTKNINGFAATLEEEEATELANHPDVVSVFLDESRKLQTSHSWSFLGLENDGVIPNSSLWVKARFGQDVIIANLDTGVWPEAKSFSDEAFGLVPSKWRGYCQENDTQGFRCNRKLIGGRHFNKGYGATVGKLNSSLFTTRDYDGHGSHTLSTAAGNIVSGVQGFGEGKSTIKGGSPNARVAAYKVCWPAMGGGGGEGCYDADLLASFDGAIHDGVDVISVSLSGRAREFDEDVVAIGAFHAVRRGITVVVAAGNYGPGPKSITNLAPWFLTVGASTTDRAFLNTVALGNRKHFKGSSFSSTLPSEKFYPLISAVAANSSASDSEYCTTGTLDPKKVKGKILVCFRGEGIERLEQGFEALRAGAVGMILVNAEENGNDISDNPPQPLPATNVGYFDGRSIEDYINSTKNPVALFNPVKAVFGIKPAPTVAEFSSRGPNAIEPSILKPDVIAPGVDILAAYSPLASPTDTDLDKRHVLYNFLSGTSMATPHVAGIVGLLKVLHPDWSPAAISSAIITTGRTRDNDNKPIIDVFSQLGATPHDLGGGHVSPSLASDPGLVYDLTTDDYLSLLCARGYKEKQLKLFFPQPYSCPKSFQLLDFNYPSITVPNLNGSITVSRTVKNVGSAGTYVARYEAPAGVIVSVEPTSLKFVKIGEEKTFEVTLTAARNLVRGNYVFGALTWSDGLHNVRSPLAVMHI